LKLKETKGRRKRNGYKRNSTSRAFRSSKRDFKIIFCGRFNLTMPSWDGNTNGRGPVPKKNYIYIYTHTHTHKYKGKGKVIPLRTRSDPEGG